MYQLARGTVPKIRQRHGNDHALAAGPADPHLQNLPSKIETNEHSQLVLSPHKPQHGHRQMRLGELLRDHLDRPGRRAVEFAVETRKGIKVPDVVWLSDVRWTQSPDDAEASPVMPELCIEVLSESNTEEGMEEKHTLYVDEGAQEVWTCDSEGTIHFCDESGARSSSAPDAASRADLEEAIVVAGGAPLSIIPLCTRRSCSAD